MTSPYRCETCNQTILGKCPATKICANSINDTSAIYRLTEVIGCASHSDFQSEEKMLDEVYDAMISSDEIRGDCMRDAIRVLKELRGEK